MHGWFEVDRVNRWCMDRWMVDLEPLHIPCRQWRNFGLKSGGQGRIKASAGPGAVPNAGPLQTYNQLTTPTNCGPQNCGPGCYSTPKTP